MAGVRLQRKRSEGHGVRADDGSHLALHLSHQRNRVDGTVRLLLPKTMCRVAEAHRDLPNRKTSKPKRTFPRT